MADDPQGAVEVRISTGAWRHIAVGGQRGRAGELSYPLVEVAQSLPALCGAHGLPAVERREAWIRFYRTPSETAPARAGMLLRSFLTFMVRSLRLLVPRTAFEVVGALHGRWPLCARCARRSDRLRWSGHALAAFGPLTFVMLIVAFALAGPGQVPIPLVLLAFPVGIPVSVILAVLAYAEARALIDCRSLVDGAVIVQVHRKFADALGEDHRSMS